MPAKKHFALNDARRERGRAVGCPIRDRFGKNRYDTFDGTD